MSGGCLVPFGLIFMLPGLGIIWFLGINPLLKVLDAKGWTGVPAEVLSSEVKTHQDSDGDTYSIHIRYRYAWGIERMTSERYDFVSGSSSGRASKQRVVDQYPLGHEFTAWVNPNDPNDVVIDRSYKLFYFGMIAFGSVFALVGGGIIVGGLISVRKSKALSAGAAPGAAASALPQPPHPDESGTLVLKPDAGPWMKVFGILLITLFWNGIISVFLYNIWSEAQSGNFPIGLSLFMIPFVLGGLGLLGGFIYTLLAAFNPRVLLLIGPGQLRCGGSYTLDWEFLGSTQRLRDFTLTLEGCEKATYRQGTSTSTATNVFYRTTLVHREEGQPLDNGSISLAFPPELMHSFQSANNKIEWKLSVHGNIPHWPDLSASYPIVLLPIGVGTP